MAIHSLADNLQSEASPNYLPSPRTKTVASPVLEHICWITKERPSSPDQLALSIVVGVHKRQQAAQLSQIGFYHLANWLQLSDGVIVSNFLQRRAKRVRDPREMAALAQLIAEIGQHESSSSHLGPRDCQWISQQS